MKSAVKQHSITLLMITLGCVFFSIGINGFIIPHNLINGGISGIALILYYLMGIPVGTSNLILNIPIMYAAYRWLGGWYVLVSIFGTVMFSLVLDAFFFLRTMGFTQDPIIGSILGGIFAGLGSGIMYRVGGNSGGLDIIGAIVRKYWGLQIGSVVFAINTLIIVIAACIFNIEVAAITLISLYISATISNKVVTGFNQRKAAFIISYNTENVCKVILKSIGRGATILRGEGAYTHQEKQVILVVISLTQIAKLKNEINRVDPNAFMLITDASEVIGQGFTFKYNTPPPIVQEMRTREELEKKKKEEHIKVIRKGGSHENQN